jgi:hypothetical protein
VNSLCHKFEPQLFAGFSLRHAPSPVNGLPGVNGAPVAKTGTPETAGEAGEAGKSGTSWKARMQLKVEKAGEQATQ